MATMFMLDYSLGFDTEIFAGAVGGEGGGGKFFFGGGGTFFFVVAPMQLFIHDL